MHDKILILDFGSQYTQLIARAVREANVFCEIIPFHKEIKFDHNLKGVILSGSPFSVNEADATITHHVEGSLFPEDLGKDFRRSFRIEGGTFTLSFTSTSPEGFDVTRTLRFRRPK